MLRNCFWHIYYLEKQKETAKLEKKETQKEHENIIDLLAMPDAAEIDFEPAKLNKIIYKNQK